MKVVDELVSNYVNPGRQEAWEEYNQALELMKENPGKYVEIQRAGLLTTEHKEMWKILSDFHDTLDWEARYPEVGTCVLYGRVPEKLGSKVKRWLAK